MGSCSRLLDAFGADADRLSDVPELARFGENLQAAIGTARTATEHLAGHAGTDPNALLSASTPYLRLLGTVVCAGLLARAALARAGADAGGGADDAAFRHAKVVSARFFGEQILPTATGLLGAITAGSADLFALTPDQLLTACPHDHPRQFEQFDLPRHRLRVRSILFDIGSPRVFGDTASKC